MSSTDDFKRVKNRCTKKIMKLELFWKIMRLLNDVEF